MSEWKRVRLGDVCTKDSSNLTLKDLKIDSGKYPVYGASGYITKIAHYKQNFPYLAIVKDGAGIGRIMQLPKRSSVIGTMQYIIPNDNIDIRYLYYALIHANLKKYHTGATIPHIYFKDYQKELIPLPPLPVQQRIAAELDHINNLINKRKKQLELLDQLVKAKFIEMFGDPRSSTQHPFVQLVSIAKVISGGTPDRKNASFWGGNVNWIKTTELKNCTISNSQEKISSIGLANSSAKVCPERTILLAMYGQGKTRGMTALLTQPSATNQACACILPSNKYNSYYLWQYLILCYDDIRALAKGGNQPNLNGNMVKNYKILYPSLQLQNKFARFVYSIHSVRNKIIKALQSFECLTLKIKTQYN